MGERLWSEEVGMCDPDARSTERDIGYEWSSGRRFRDGIGAYEPTYIPTVEDLLQQYLFYNPQPPAAEVVAEDNVCYGDVVFDEVFVMHTEAEGSIVIPLLSLSAGVTYSLYRQLLTNDASIQPELLEQFNSIPEIYEYLYVYDPSYEFIIIAPNGDRYTYSWIRGSFSFPEE